MKKFILIFLSLITFNVLAQSGGIEKLSFQNHDFQLFSKPVAVVVYHLPFTMGERNQIVMEHLADTSIYFSYNPTIGFYRVNALSEPFLINNLGLKNFPTTIFYQYGRAVKKVEGLIYFDEMITTIEDL